ncbi:MAG: alpha-glucan family phosphorylase [Candidatus Omnitrophica bacterium]|nr:alpha-glucan family phosphorylase [Candidatus Omnitrophota bacterium]
MPVERTVAYFSMEIGLQQDIPTYSGGLGVLAGDTIRSAADLSVPMVGVTLLYDQGYFYQKLDEQGNQIEEPVQWSVDDFLQKVPQTTALTIGGREVHLRAWKYDVFGVDGFCVPVFLLDSNLEENHPDDRHITSSLYGGDDAYRFCQEMVLGIGGVRMLQALGFQDIRHHHMNEGHASLLTIELLERAKQQNPRAGAGALVENVRKQCVFTTHTPVPAGHDRFPLDLAKRLMNHPVFDEMPEMVSESGMVNMTLIGMNFSNYINGVAKLHGEVSRSMFPEYAIHSITNGVHSATWTAESFTRLFDAYIPGWKRDCHGLRHALKIPKSDIWDAHFTAKETLIRVINRETNLGLDADVFTIGFARRSATYKRADLIFHDIERLKNIAKKSGRFQIIYAGKAHPKDEGGKEIIRRIHRAAKQLKDVINVAYVANYDMGLGKLLTSGVDLWLNTPLCPREASGTSGMKAAHNGVPSLSVMDGWWVEGCIEGVTGWAVGNGCAVGEEETEADNAQDADRLYEKLEHNIIPLYYRNRDGFVSMMQQIIALNASHFNTQRMVQEYVSHAYFR